MDQTFRVVEQMPERVRAVERAIRILRVLSKTREGAGVSEIAKQVQLGKSTTHRLLNTLCEENLVRVDSLIGRYGLSYGLLQLTAEWLGRIDIRSTALPHLQGLQQLCGETVSLNVRDGSQRVAIERLETSHELRFVVDLGRPLPLHIGAGGKAILAFLPGDEVQRIMVQAGLGTRHRQRLRRELAEIHRLGAAHSVGERVPGAGSVSAPVFDHEGRVVGSVSILSLESRLSKRVVEKLRAELKRTCAAISAELGWRSAKAVETARLRVAAG